MKFMICMKIVTSFLRSTNLGRMQDQPSKLNPLSPPRPKASPDTPRQSEVESPKSAITVSSSGWVSPCPPPPPKEIVLRALWSFSAMTGVWLENMFQNYKH